MNWLLRGLRNDFWKAGFIKVGVWRAKTRAPNKNSQKNGILPIFLLLQDLLLLICRWRIGYRCGKAGMERYRMIRIYDSHHRGPCPSERVEQINAMSWLSVHHADRYELVCHVPNESRGTAMHYAMRAKEGVKAGIPDILDLGGPILGMFEMKRLDRTKSVLSADQKRILAAADAGGAFVAVCYGFFQFQLAYTDYVALCFAQQGIK